MTCQQCREQLSDLIEGDLPAEVQAEVVAHLDACADCRRLLAELRAVIGAVRSLPEVLPPPGLREQLRGSLRGRGAQARVRRALLRVRYIGSAVAAAAAALAIIYAGSSHLERQQMTGRELPAETLMVDRAPAEEKAADETPAVTEPATGGSATEMASAPPAADGEVAAPGAVVADGEPAPPTRPRRDAERGPATGGGAGHVTVPDPPPAPMVREETAKSADALAAETGATIGTRSPEPGVHMMGAGGAAPPAGAGGPAGPPGPARSAMAEGGHFAAQGLGAGSTAQRVEPKYFAPDSAWVAIADPAGDTPFTVSVYPPSRRAVGEVVPATVAVETERTVERARIQVAGSPTLEIVDLPEDGVIYRGPLVGNERTEQTVRMRARAPGRQSMWINLRSSHPEVETDLEVDLGEFHEVVPATENCVKAEFVEVPVRAAIDEITLQSGMQVQVQEGLPDRRITIDFSNGVPAGAALMIVVEDVGWTVRTDGEVQMVEPR